MVATRQAGTLNRVANRLNYDMAGSRSLLYGTADRLLAGAPGHSVAALAQIDARWGQRDIWSRSEEHTSEIQSLMRISYAVFCLKKKHSEREETTTNTRL